VTVTVEPMTAADWPEVARIYAEGIATGDATFETEVPDWATWDAAHLPDHRLVARDGGRVLGWVACSPVSGRCVYAGVVEASVYVAAATTGRGIGRALLRAFLAGTDAAGIWTVEAGIFPENVPSLALHQGAGFRVVGTSERIGRMADGRWRDVVRLERRSPVVS
jgi:L-amino acid N-acyltransferase YncA